MSKKNRAGFTLVELMVVAIIVAILAAVAIPLMSGSKRRAVGTEAEAALGTCRTALRAMFAESGSYNLTPANRTLTAGMSVTNIPGIVGTDLDGTYFQQGCYTISAIGANNYTLQALGSVSTNLLAQPITITLNDQGTFIRSGM